MKPHTQTAAPSPYAAFTPAMLIETQQPWSIPQTEIKAPDAANDAADTRRPNILEKRRRRRARMAAR